MQVGGGNLIARCGGGGLNLGLSAGPGPTQVTCTSIPAGVEIYDLASGDCVQSWALNGGVRPSLSAKVCYCLSVSFDPRLI